MRKRIIHPKCHIDSGLAGEEFENDELEKRDGLMV